MGVAARRTGGRANLKIYRCSGRGCGEMMLERIGSR